MPSHRPPRLRYTVDQSKQRAEKATARAARLEDLLERVTDTQGDKFTMTVDARASRSARTLVNGWSLSSSSDSKSHHLAS
jgi:hypothetical protein